MDTVEVKLLNYRFRFRQLRWREEFDIKYEPKKDRLRTLLAYALDEVSSLPVRSVGDAERVLDAVPSPIIYRIFLIYKSKLKPPRVFKTLGLYKAPEPSKLIRKIEQADQERERVMDRVEQEMEAKFGREELREARELEMLMVKNSKGRGLSKASPEGIPPSNVPATAPSAPQTMPARPSAPSAPPPSSPPPPPFRKKRR